MRVLSIILLLIPSAAIADESVIATSFINLLVYPDNLDGRKLFVYGYLGPLGERLYLTKDHSEGKDELSSVKIYHDYQVPATDVYRPCLNSYVYVQGKFNKDSESKLAGINQIERMYAPSTEKSLKCDTRKQ